MKKAPYILLFLFSTLLYSCTQKSVCRIEGTVNNPRAEGRYVFLVPVEGAYSTDRVDSFCIKNQAFTFEVDSEMVASLRLDYRVRLGTEEHLLVTEQGVVRVHLDSVSTGSGTPLNDTLQILKRNTIATHHIIQSLYDDARLADEQNDTTQAKKLRLAAEQKATEHKQYLANLANNMRDGALKNFLQKMYKSTH